jgi:hypothetical protein
MAFSMTAMSELACWPLAHITHSASVWGASGGSTSILALVVPILNPPPVLLNTTSPSQALLSRADKLTDETCFPGSCILSHLGEVELCQLLHPLALLGEGRYLRVFVQTQLLSVRSDRLGRERERTQGETNK